MIINELSLNEWDVICKQVCFQNVFSSSNYIAAYASIFELTSKQFVILKNNHPQVLLAVHCKGRSIVLPSQYTFTAVWLNPHASENSINDSLRMLLAFLKGKFNRIAFKLPIEISDARPFKWEGFNTDVRYTYIKELSTLEYHQNIKRILAKYAHGYEFRVNKWDEEAENFHRIDLQQYGLNPSIIAKILEVFTKLFKNGNLLIVSAYRDNKIVASNLISLDKSNRKAYIFIISKNGTIANEAGLPAYMYDYCFKHLRNEGFEFVDMSGANISEIAHFKAKYKPILTSYLEVRYDYKLNVLSRIMPGIKKFGIWLPH